MIRKLLPSRVKRPLRRMHRRFELRRAMKKVKKNPLLAVEDDRCLQSLIYGWGNEGWSAENEYLRYMVRLVASLGEQDILECGSGLSTLLLAATAVHNGSRITTLENDPKWGDRVRAELQRHGLAKAVRLHVAPLRDYDAFAWYSVPVGMGPFAAVVCDGPPGSTRGGRSGLMPVMRDRLSSGCRILLDDTARKGEQEILARWERELHVTHRAFGEKKPFAELIMPASLT